MKTIKLLAVAIIALCLASCNGSITPVSQKIKGPLGEFFQIDEREYSFKDGELIVEFERITKGGPQNANLGNPTFVVQLLDNDDNIVSSATINGNTKADELNNILSLDVNESGIIKLRFRDYKGTKKFRVSSKLEEVVTETVRTEVDYRWLSTRYVYDSDLAGLNKGQLRVLRNAIYAMHGYIFNSPELSGYFSSFSWYNPIYTSDIYSTFTELERSNVEAIKDYERFAPEGQAPELLPYL